MDDRIKALIRRIYEMTTDSPQTGDSFKKLMRCTETKKRIEGSIELEVNGKNTRTSYVIVMDRSDDTWSIVSIDLLP